MNNFVVFKYDFILLQQIAHIFIYFKVCKNRVTKVSDIYFANSTGEYF